MNIRAKIYGSTRSDPVVVPEAEKRPEKGDAMKRGNSRNADRHRLSEEKVRLTRNGVSHDSDLINVSGGGAMIGASFEANVWDTLELHLGENGTIECVVRWIKSGRMGLEFAHETKLDCSADQQAVLLREVIDRTYKDARFSHPGSGSDSSNSFPRKERASDHRRAKRHPLIWSGLLHFDGRRAPVRVRNISATGAMVQCASAVPVGVEGMLQLGDSVCVSATVGWAVGDQIGLHFQSDFDMSELARSTPEVAPARWERPSYLNKEAVSASPWDPKWQRLSVKELSQELDGFLKR